MRRIARLSDGERRELFRNTADKMGLNDAVVEKDFRGASRQIICSTVQHGRIISPSRVAPVSLRCII